VESLTKKLKNMFQIRAPALYCYCRHHNRLITQQLISIKIIKNQRHKTIYHDLIIMAFSMLSIFNKV
jgi:hypothetical protein